jgi:hypothetical protein
MACLVYLVGTRRAGYPLSAAAVAVLLTGCRAVAGPAGQEHPQPQLGRAIAPVRATSRSPVAGSHLAPPPPLSESEPEARRHELAGARPTASRFFAAYVRFLYGEIPPSAVPDIDPRFRSRLQAGGALITPTEKATRPRILVLTLRPAGPPVSALATVAIAAGDRQYRLTATLEPRHGGWVVVTADG